MTGRTRESPDVRLVLLLAAVAVGSASGRAAAAPRADLVVVWAPGRTAASIERATRGAGAALIDRSPAPDGEPATAAALRRGIDAYEGLRLDDAWAALSEARTLADRTGAATLTAATLSDLFLYRGLAQLQRGEPDAAWDELVTAAAVAPTRVLDPARFGPRVIDLLERARAAALARPRVELVIVAPAGCAVAVDGAAASPGPIAAISGPHWIHARCAGATWGARVDAVDPVTRVAIAPREPAPPSDDDVLIQARAAGARAVVIVIARREIATVRLLGIDGRERERRTVALGGGDRALAAAVADLLRAEPAPRWYRSRWAWAAGAAALAAAILIPVTVAIVDEGPPPSVTIRGPDALP